MRSILKRKLNISTHLSTSLKAVYELLLGIVDGFRGQPPHLTVKSKLQNRILKKHKQKPSFQGTNSLERGGECPYGQA